MNELEKSLYSAIPPARAMGIRVKGCTRVESELFVPLSLNHNHHGTAYGGSLYSACTAACYTLLYFLQSQDAITGLSLVIAEGEIKYQRPVDKDFTVRAKVSEAAWDNVRDKLRLGRKSKITLEASIHTPSSDALCLFKGVFAFI